MFYKTAERESYLSIINFCITYRFYIEITIKPLSLVHLLTTKKNDVWRYLHVLGSSLSPVLQNGKPLQWGVFVYSVFQWNTSLYFIWGEEKGITESKPTALVKREALGRGGKKYPAKAENALLNPLYLKHIVKFGSKMYLKVVIL